MAELQPLVHKAQRWLLDNVTDEAIGNGGYRQITGRSSLRPAENCLWLLAWTVEALLRLSERNAPGAE